MAPEVRQPMKGGTDIEPLALSGGGDENAQLVRTTLEEVVIERDVWLVVKVVVEEVGWVVDDAVLEVMLLVEEKLLEYRTAPIPTAAPRMTITAEAATILPIP